MSQAYCFLRDRAVNKSHIDRLSDIEEQFTSIERLLKELRTRSKMFPRTREE